MTAREVAAYLNGLDDAAVRTAFTRCCAASRWVDGMLARRPFADDAAVFAAADEIWRTLSPADWREAFAAHPRIGERAAAGAWSRREQAGMETASAEIARRLADGNRRYEERFGHVFLICATGRSAEEMLAALERRLTNDPATELQEAATEHAAITRLRLAKLVTS